jgi:hypothetical protein
MNAACGSDGKYAAPVASCAFRSRAARSGVELQHAALQPAVSPRAARVSVWLQVAVLPWDVDAVLLLVAA